MDWVSLKSTYTSVTGWMDVGLGFGFWGSVLEVSSFGYMVWGLGFKVEVLRFAV